MIKNNFPILLNELIKAGMISFDCFCDIRIKIIMALLFSPLKLLVLRCINYRKNIRIWKYS